MLPGVVEALRLEWPRPTRRRCELRFSPRITLPHTAQGVPSGWHSLVPAHNHTHAIYRKARHHQSDHWKARYEMQDHDSTARKARLKGWHDVCVCAFRASCSSHPLEGLGSPSGRCAPKPHTQPWPWPELLSRRKRAWPFQACAVRAGCHGTKRVSEFNYVWRRTHARRRRCASVREEARHALRARCHALSPFQATLRTRVSVH